MEEYQDSEVIILPQSVMQVILHLLEEYGTQYRITPEQIKAIGEFVAAKDENIAIDVASDKELRTMDILDDIYSGIVELIKYINKGDTYNANFTAHKIKNYIEDIMAVEGYYPRDAGKE